MVEKIQEIHVKVENKIIQLTEDQKIVSEASLLSESLGQARMTKKMTHKI